MNIKFLYLLLLFWIGTFAIAQPTDQKKLEEKKAQILNEITVFQSLLNKEKKKEKSVLNELANNNSRIKLSDRLIATNEKQTKLLESDIVAKRLYVEKLTQELEVLKDDYAEMILKAYKSKSEQTRIMFILSSKDFLQAYKRMQYMKQYSEFRKMQALEIKDKKEKLHDEIKKLNDKKAKKVQVIQQTEAEKKILEEKQKEKELLIKDIQKDKKKYLADINKKQKEAREIDAKIQKAIKDAIALANKRNAEKLKAEREKNKANDVKSTTPVAENTDSSKIALTPEGQIVSTNFKANKGRLPWPVEAGYISLGYGNHADPVHKNIIIPNSGVEITTKSGASALAIFSGEVLQVQLISSNNKAVFIKHGDFITIYLNLESVSVKIGDKVTEKQPIGKIHTDSSGNTIIKFMVTQNSTTLNPQTWIRN